MGELELNLNLDFYEYSQKETYRISRDGSFWRILCMVFDGKKPIAISPILIMVTVWIVYDIWLSIKNGEINSSGITVRYKENSILFIFFTLAEAIALLFLIWMYIENLRTGQPEN